MKKVILMVLGILMISSLAWGQEILTNGTFENWDSTTSPTDWTHVENITQESTAGLVHSGTYSAKHIGGTKDLGQTVTGIVSGDEYTITLWYKVTAGDATSARIWSYWKNGTNNLNDNASELRGPNNSYFNNNGGVWTEYTVTLNAPATADGFYFEVRTYSGATVYWDDFSLFHTSASSATITLTPTSLDGFTYIVGNGPSAEQSFTAEGSNLDADISITPPTNYEISTGTGGAFSATNPITLTQSGGSVNSTTIYIRLKEGLGVGNYNGENITASSTGADNKTVTCSGSVTSPDNPGNFSSTAFSATQIDLLWTQNSSSDNVMVVYDEDGTFTDPENGTAYSVSSTACGGTVIYNGTDQAYNHIGLSANTTYYYKAWSVDGDDNYSSGITDNETTPKEEPSNHVTNFSVTADGNSKIDLSWTANDGTVVPDGYLIKASTSDNVSEPLDFIVVNDDATIGNDSGAKNIAHGTNLYEWTGLDAETTYYFKIYPYTNSGNNIDYKTDGTIPNGNATTDAEPDTPALIISEVADPGDDWTGRFVEIYNNSGSSVDFSSTTWYLCFQSNGSNWTDAQLSGVIVSDGCFVFSYEDAADFNTIYGVNSDQNHGNFNGNGDDGYFLYFNGDHTTGTLIDAYGVIDEDGTGKDWEYENSRAVRSGVTKGNATWTASEWTITSADVADCTPGELDDGQTLPITLSTFSASVNSKNFAQIDWITESETDLSHFSIYRNESEDFASADFISNIEPKGGSNFTPYSYLDKAVEQGKTYNYWLEIQNLDTTTEVFGPRTVTLLEDVVPGDDVQLFITKLNNAFPNPFNPNTTISFELAIASDVIITIYNNRGQLVKTFDLGFVEDHSNSLVWNGKDEIGNDCSTGVYLYKLETKDSILTNKMILMK